MNFIGRPWKGGEDLWKVFWLYGFLFSLVWGYLVKHVGFGPAATLYFQHQPKMMFVWIGLFAGFGIIYKIWLFVSLWRCAFNAKWAIWGYLIRIVEVLEVIAIIGGLLAAYFLGMFSLLAEPFTGKMNELPSQQVSPACQEIYDAYNKTIAQSQGLKPRMETEIKYRQAILMCERKVKTQGEAPAAPPVQVITVQPAAPHDNVQQPAAAPSPKPGFSEECEKLAASYGTNEGISEATRKRREEMIRNCQNMH